MEIIIPMAGLGTRMRPHTLNKPKPLIHVAGKPMLQHILDRILPLKPEKVHFIVGPFKEKVEDFLTSCPMCYTIKTQEVPNGDGGAIMLAKPHVDPESDLLIVFSDTIFETDFSQLDSVKNKENMVWVQEVEDPSRFGVVFLEDNKIVKFIEKPKEPISKLAVIGMYYVRKAKFVFDELQTIMDEDVKSKGEYRLIDALAKLIEKGEVIRPGKTDAWLDCGTPEALLNTNNILLKKLHKTIKTENSVIIEPVYIEEGAKISNSIIGPNVSIGANSIIDNSIIKNSIVNVEADIKGAQIASSIIGSDALVIGTFKQMNVSENSQIISKNID